MNTLENTKKAEVRWAIFLNSKSTVGLYAGVDWQTGGKVVAEGYNSSLSEIWPVKTWAKEAGARECLEWLGSAAAEYGARVVRVVRVARGAWVKVGFAK